MKKRNLQRIFAAFMASALAVGTVACGGNGNGDKTTPTPEAGNTTPEATPDPGTSTTPDASTPEVTPEPDDEPAVLIDPATGNPMDLGGMHIIIRDWWSGEPGEPSNDFEEARQEWRDYIQETYNFTIEEKAISDWGSAPADFVDYCTTGDDGENYVFVLRNDPAITSAMNQGLMYDLATIPWLDFSTDKFMRNKNHELYAKGSSIYGMAAGYSEARSGVFFNKDLIRDAGIDPETIYDMQANGTWTWDAFDQICAAVQRDVNNDGIDDYYGITVNEGIMDSAAMWSNGGAYVLKSDAGYVYNLEAPETVEALTWVAEMFTKYDNHDPEGAQWDYYKEEFLSGKVAFMIDDAYNATNNGGNILGGVDAEVNFEYGFVFFPKGRSDKAKYTNCWANNIVAIPGCYSKDKAEKIAFAWNLYTDMPAGYENYKDLSNYRSGLLDSRGIDETVAVMMEPDYGCVNYATLVPDLNTTQIEWNIAPNCNVSSVIEACRDEWKQRVEDANK